MLENKGDLKEKLFKLAEKGDLSILNHPSVDIVKDKDGWTPLQARLRC